MTDQGDFDGRGERSGRQLRGESRLAAEEDEYWAMKQARRARDLAEVAYDAMSRGDAVEVHAGGAVFFGTVQHARNDLLSIEGRTHADINLATPVLLRVVQAGAGQGTEPSAAGPESFSSRLAELEQSGVVLRFVTLLSGSELTGRVAIRARDHVIVEAEAGAEWIIPLRSLMAVEQV